VTVEVRKTRTFAQGAGGMVEVKPQGAPAGFNAASLQSMQDDESMRHLTSEKKQARLKALKVAEEEMKRVTQNPPAREEERKTKAKTDPAVSEEIAAVAD